MPSFDPKNFMSPGYDPIAGNRQAVTSFGDQGRGKADSFSNFLQNQETESVGAGRGQTKSYADLIVNQPGAGRGTSQSQITNPTNTLVHNTDNIIANGNDTDLLRKAFVPNILDNYDVVTYHWKFFMVDNDAASAGTIFNTDSQTIIAESGVSDLTIDKVEIYSITTPSIESGTGTSTNVKFEVVEPGGARLIDQIFYQSLALGIGNWNVMPFYLQLQFRGRTPETSQADDGPGTIGGLRWVYPIKITSIKANVTTVGTRYEFTAIIYNEYAQSNTVFSLQYPVVLNDLSTFKDAMMKLAQSLNDDQYFKCIDNTGLPDSFKIVIDPILNNADYNITPANNNTNTARNSSMDVFTGKNATFPAGTSIDKIIDSLLSQTNGFQTQLINSQTPGAEGQTMTAENNQMKTFWKIVTETRPLKFDPRRNDYAREYTIFVIQYDIGVLDQNTFQDASPPTTIDAERKRLMTYIKKSVLKKKYNYIFTGLNDQVINFDIKINNAFAVALARMGGVYFNSAMADKSVVTQDNSNLEASITSKIQRAISFQNTSSLAASPDGQAALKEAVAAVNASKLPPDRQAAIIAQLTKGKATDRLNFNQERQAAGAFTDPFNLAKQNATNRAIERGDLVPTSNLNFISNVETTSADAQVAYANYVKGIKGRLRPVARVDSMQQAQVGSGLDSNSNSGLQKLSSMFSVALHSPYDTSFASVTLSIKGDPFWLFPQPYTDSSATTRIYNSLKSDDDAIAYLKNAHSKTVDAVNIYGSDNFIIVRFRTPRLFNVDANPDPISPNTDVESFSGVFKVISVKSTFDTGRFHQEMHCILDYNINILNFMAEIEGNARKEDVPAKPESLVDHQVIPATSVSTPRIMGQNTITSAVQTAQNAASTIGSSVASAVPSNIPSALPNLLNLSKNRFT